MVKIKLEWLNMHYLVPKKSKLSSKPGNGFQQERQSTNPQNIYAQLHK